MLIAVAAIATSCTDNLNLDTPSDGEVRITSGINTRVIDTQWEVNDAIGVYMNSISGTLGAYGSNAEYVTTNGDGNFTSTDPLYYPESGSVNFLAYYPYVDDANFDATAYSVDVTSQSDLPAIDLMTASASNKSKSSDAVYMAFSHQLSNLVLTMIPGGDWTNADLVGLTVQLVGTDTKAAYNLSTNVITLSGSVADITLNTAADGLTAEAIVIPQSLSDARFAFTTVTGGTVYVDIPTAAFVSGVKYNYNVTIDATGVSLSNATIGGWNNGDEDASLSVTLSQSSMILYEGETATLTAYVYPEGLSVVWECSNEGAITVDQYGVVTAVSIGDGYVYAIVGDKFASCYVSVQEKPKYPSLQGSEYYTLILDDYSYAEIEERVVYDFRPDDVDNFLYIWATYIQDTYTEVTATGLNSYDNDGGYLALTVNNVSWSGCGFFVDGAKVEAVWSAIQENPTDYYLHMAFKSAANYSHCFRIFGVEDAASYIGVGPTAVYDATVMYDFTRDGEWHEIEVPLSELDLSGFTPSDDGVNALVILTEGVYGADLNLDAVFIYKK